MNPVERHPIRPPGTYACTACGKSYRESRRTTGGPPVCSQRCRHALWCRANGRANANPKAVRKCGACGDLFQTRTHGKAKCCSIRCAHALDRRERPGERASRYRRGAIAAAPSRAAYQAARPSLAATCGHCGRAFASKGLGGKVRRYCTDACDSAAYRADPANWVTRSCATCTTPFLALKNQPTKVCSLSCRRGKVPA